MNSREKMISINGLTKDFGTLRAVDNISFDVHRGEVLGFLGPNGAGKSTTMKMVTGYLPITSGYAEVCGHDVVTQPLESRRRIGYLPEGAPLYGDMTTSGFLNFIADVRELKGEERRRRIEDVTKKLGLEPVFNRPIETLSKGFKRRVGMAQAMLHDPDILILDEPTDGLDPNQKHQVRELIMEMAKEKAIIISTHILEEVTAVCTRAIIIAAGRILFDGTPDQLAGKSPTHNAVTIHFANNNAGAAADDITAMEEVDRVDYDADSGIMLVVPKNGAPIIDKLSLYVRDKGIEVEELYVDRGQLDDVFRHLTIAA